MAKQNKRKTPIDDLKILDEWKELHKSYSEIGLSNHAAYCQIAKIYNCSHDIARYWLQPEVRLSQIRGKKSSLVPYSKKSDVENRRIHSRISIDIRRNPDIYLKEVYCGRDIALSLDEITLCLRKLSGIELRNKTLLKVVRKYEEKNNVSLLNKIDGKPYFVLGF